MAMSKAIKLDGKIPKVYAERMGYIAAKSTVMMRCTSKRADVPSSEPKKTKRYFEIDPGQEDLF